MRPLCPGNDRKLPRHSAYRWTLGDLPCSFQEMTCMLLRFYLMESRRMQPASPYVAYLAQLRRAGHLSSSLHFLTHLVEEGPFTEESEKVVWCRRILGFVLRPCPLLPCSRPVQLPCGSRVPEERFPLGLLPLWDSHPPLALTGLWNVVWPYLLPIRASFRSAAQLRE